MTPTHTHTHPHTHCPSLNPWLMVSHPYIPTFTRQSIHPPPPHTHTHRPSPNPWLMSNHPTHYYHRHFNCRQCRAAELMWIKTPTSSRLKVPVPPSARYEHFPFLWGIFDCFPFCLFRLRILMPPSKCCVHVFFGICTFCCHFLAAGSCILFGISMCVFASFHKHLYMFIHIFLYEYLHVFCVHVFFGIYVSWCHFLTAGSCIFLDIHVYLHKRTCIYYVCLYIYCVQVCFGV